MKELNSVEVQEVSGAGLFTDIGLTMGAGIGSIVDAATGKGNVGAQSGTLLGAGIGAIFDALFGGLSSLFGSK